MNRTKPEDWDVVHNNVGREHERDRIIDDDQITDEKNLYQVPAKPNRKTGLLGSFMLQVIMILVVAAVLAAWVYLPSK